MNKTKYLHYEVGKLYLCKRSIYSKIDDGDILVCLKYTDSYQSYKSVDDNFSVWYSLTRNEEVVINTDNLGFSIFDRLYMEVID